MAHLTQSIRGSGDVKQRGAQDRHNAGPDDDAEWSLDPRQLDERRDARDDQRRRDEVLCLSRTPVDADGLNMRATWAVTGSPGVRERRCTPPRGSLSSASSTTY